MATVYVKLGDIGSGWTKACKDAIAHLNTLFVRNKIDVVLQSGSKTPTISVRTDSSITGNLVHGRTSAEVTASGKLLRADIRLPETVSINTPDGPRGAGSGVLEVIAAHEFVHALGHEPHNTRLMGQTLAMELGDSPSGDKLKDGTVGMPPLVLSPQSVKQLKDIWS